MKCESCLFWEESKFLCPINGAIKGNCCRFPPILIQAMVRNWDDANEASVWIYPTTESDEWCGEFKQISLPDGTRE
jgi:hypothetical protein